MAPTPDREHVKETETVPATKARQGVMHQGVRYVLGISLVLVIVGFILAYVLA